MHQKRRGFCILSGWDALPSLKGSLGPFWEDHCKTNHMPSGPVRLLLTLLVVESLPFVPSLTQRRVQLAPSINWSRISKKSQVSDVSWFGKSSISSPMPSSFWTALLYSRPPLFLSGHGSEAFPGFEMLSEWWRLAQEPLSSLTIRGLTMPLPWVELSLNIFYCRDQTAWDLGWGAGFGFLHTSPI